MKTATAISILATVITTSEGKKSKTSNDFYNSKDGDRFAAKWEPGHDEWGAPSHDDWWGAPSHDDWWGAPSHDDHDDWWAPSSSSHDEWWAPSSHDEWWGSSAKPRSGWNSKSSKSSNEWWGSSAKPSNGWSSKGSKPSGSWNDKSGKGDGWSGSSGFHCKHKTFYIDLDPDEILDDVEVGSNKFTNSYTNYRAYKSSSDVGNNSYDGIFAYRKEHVSDFSCQGQGMLGLDGGPIFKDQIYVSTMCDPFIDEPDNSGFITDGGITGGFGDYASATGTMKYEKSGGTGKLKFWICLR